ncbi:MAG: CDP-alcohol phosphatidyltransferase family protein [Flavobacteriales bacterium]|nr:CDP-alcohol phosphatidyltransferase family protein [Flavobacteriales bacterium]MBL6868460.1 CDP-alcohol phosphatidyltransferase family protein [Flavobacteriales bacterium]
MISFYKIKPKFQKLLKPILVGLYKFGITANQITVSSIFLSFFIGISLWFHTDYRWGLLVVPIGLLVRMALNALDGMMARTYNMQSKLGEVLNEIGDVISDLFIFIPMTQIKGLNHELLAFFIGLSIINEFAGFMGKLIGKERRYDGPMGKSDRAFLVGIICCILFFKPIELIIINSIFIGASSLIVLSTVIRLKKGLRDG